MKKVEDLKKPKKVPRKKHPLGVLKRKARLSLESGQNSVYVRVWVRNRKLHVKTIYYLARSLESTLSCPVEEFAKSARFAAMIRRDYGLPEFEKFLKELKKKTET